MKFNLLFLLPVQRSLIQWINSRRHSWLVPAACLSDTKTRKWVNPFTTSFPAVSHGNFLDLPDHNSVEDSKPDPDRGRDNADRRRDERFLLGPHLPTFL